MKKVLISFIVVFISMEILGYVENLILGPTYQSLQHLWRSDMGSLLWIYHVIMLVSAFFFSFIFSKGYEGKGIMEGIRYGLYIGIWFSTGMAFGTYAMIAEPASLAWQQFISGIIQYLVYGIVISFVYGKKTAKA